MRRDGAPVPDHPPVLVDQRGPQVDGHVKGKQGGDGGVKAEDASVVDAKGNLGCGTVVGGDQCVEQLAAALTAAGNRYSCCAASVQALSHLVRRCEAHRHDQQQHPPFPGQPAGVVGADDIPQQRLVGE